MTIQEAIQKLSYELPAGYFVDLTVSCRKGEAGDSGWFKLWRDGGNYEDLGEFPFPSSENLRLVVEAVIDAANAIEERR